MSRASARGARSPGRGAMGREAVRSPGGQPAPIKAGQGSRLVAGLGADDRRLQSFGLGNLVAVRRVRGRGRLGILAGKRAAVLKLFERRCRGLVDSHDETGADLVEGCPDLRAREEATLQALERRDCGSLSGNGEVVTSLGEA